MAFGRLCMERFESREAQEAWLRKVQFQPAAPEQAAALTRRVAPGAVWLSPYVGRPVAVVLRDAGITCQVMSPLAEPQQAVAAFRALLDGAGRRGGFGVAMVDEQRDAPGAAGAGWRLIYHLRPGQAAPAFPVHPDGLTLVMSVRPPVEGGIALLMTASRAAPR